jgi:Fe-S cluster assembly iron-binding protein IscA
MSLPVLQGKEIDYVDVEMIKGTSKHIVLKDRA